MDGTQTVVAAAAVGLLAANEWTNSDRGVFGGVLWNGSDPAAAHAALVRVGGELLLVFVLVILAGLNGSWPMTVGAIVAALWVLFLMRRSTGTAKAAGPAPSATPHLGG